LKLKLLIAVLLNLFISRKRKASTQSSF